MFIIFLWKISFSLTCSYYKKYNENISNDLDEIARNQDVSSMGNFNDNINYIDVKPTCKPKLLRRLLKNFRRRSMQNDYTLINGNLKSDKSNY
jgi:hypothetical protein